ncbi:MAG TPA: hypothetical protein VK897_14625 [Anaerolineales bacterium]|nr:hypothetical protein [Anaerolineales bacterium]
MTRLSKVLSLTVVLVFLLACNFVTGPIRDAQNLAETAQSVSTLIPFETLQALPSVLPSVIPAETLEALPSAIPSVEALATQFGNTLDPQGTPVQEWKGVPVMPQAIAGQEFGDTYSFRVNATAQEIQEFYNQELTALGWNQPLEFPIESGGGFLYFDKENSTLTIFIVPSEGSMVVLLTLA